MDELPNGTISLIRDISKKLEGGIQSLRIRLAEYTLVSSPAGLADAGRRGASDDNSDLREARVCQASKGGPSDGNGGCECESLNPTDLSHSVQSLHI